jgi:hypothetical protein
MDPFREYPDPLDGARLKIVRAQQHLDSLKHEIMAYIRSKPYEFPIEDDGEYITVRDATISENPPVLLSCIIGDCVCNLRAALDYIAWQLAAHNFPGLQIGTDRVYFPISETPQDFKPDRLTKYGIPATVVSLIESVQPYHAGYETLALLKLLVNQDKHCLPLLALATATTAEMQVFQDGEVTIEGKITGGVALKLGAEGLFHPD